MVPARGMNMKRLLLLAVWAFLTMSPVAMAGITVFEDDFSNDQSGWPNTQIAEHDALGISLYDGSGGYQMTPLDDATYGILPAPRQAKSGDVEIETAVFLYTGVGKGTAGVVCRHQDNGNFYAFMVSGGHGYTILKVANGQGETLASGRFDGAMPNIADVRLQAVCDGSNLSLSIDGVAVAQASDRAFSNGRSALIVLGERTAGTSAVFDHFVLSER